MLPGKEEKTQLFLAYTHTKNNKGRGETEQRTQAHAQNPLKPVQGEGCFCGNGAGIGGGRRGPPSRRGAE